MKELQAASNAASRAETALPDGGVLSSPFGEIDLSKHRDEAQQIWTMLDEMSDKDPEAYNKYIRQQMEDAMAEKTGRRTVTPDAGACFKTAILRANPVKREGIGNIRGTEIFPFPVLPDDVAAGQALYVNLCSHSTLPVPRTADGKSVLEAKGPRGGRREPADWPLADLLSLEIPLSVGNVRPVKGTARSEWAVDVLLHRWAIAVFEEHKGGFSANFVRFLAHVMEEELGLAFDPTPGEGGVVEAPAAAAPGSRAVVAAADIGLSESRSSKSTGKGKGSASSSSERGWRLCRASYMGGDMAPGSTKQTCVPFTVSIRVGSPAEEALRGRKEGSGATAAGGASGAAGTRSSGSRSSDGAGASAAAGGKASAGAGRADVLASPAALLQAKASEISAAGATSVASQPRIVLPGAAPIASGRGSTGSAAGAGRAAAAAAKPAPSAPATKEEKEAAAAAVASVAAAAAAIRSSAKAAVPLVQELDARSTGSVSSSDAAADAAASSGIAAAASAEDSEPRHVPLAIGGSARCALGTASLQFGDGGALVLTLVFDGAVVDTSQLRMQHVDLEVAPDAAKFTVDPSVLLAAMSAGAGAGASFDAAATTAVFVLPVCVDPAAVGARYSKKTATLTMTLQNA